MKSWESALPWIPRPISDEEKEAKLSYQHDELTERVIGCAYEVANELGCGFLEKVYENALAIELVLSGLSVGQQIPLQVVYKGAVIGDYQADLLVEGRLLVELKVTKRYEDIHMAQCINYLKATGLKTCLLLNFGTPRIGIKRISL